MAGALGNSVDHGMDSHLDTSNRIPDGVDGAEYGDDRRNAGDRRRPGGGKPAPQSRYGGYEIAARPERQLSGDARGTTRLAGSASRLEIAVGSDVDQSLELHRSDGGAPRRVRKWIPPRVGSHSLR